MGVLASCEKPAPSSRHLPAPASAPPLAAAQLALAQSHLEKSEPLKAIPYLRASYITQPLPETKATLEKILETTQFVLPTILLRHPSPILHFENRGRDLFVAVGGEHPTVIRWNLSAEPSVEAVMFPSKSGEITHLNVAPSAKFLIVHRNGLNLICRAETLKPITELPPFAENLDPAVFQPFSENGLLVANPSTGLNGNYIWRIHDSNTGQILRIESVSHLQEFSRAVSASFRGTSLYLGLADANALVIPLVGGIEILPHATAEILPTLSISGVSKTSENTLTIFRDTRLNPGQIREMSDDLLAALTGYRLDPVEQTLTNIPVPNRLEVLAHQMPGRFPETLKIFTAVSTINRRLADAFPESFPDETATAQAHAETIRKVFETGDRDAILAVIKSAPHGLPFATALYHAIESGSAEFIERTLSKAHELPPALKDLATGRSTLDTDFNALRRIEDWHGYEAPDFTPLLSRHLKNRNDLLALLTLPENLTETAISTLSLRLTDLEILETLGKPLVAEKAISAAHDLAAIPDHAEMALSLSDLALELGAHPSYRLRVRATAFTTLSDFKSAHSEWIDLITNQPEAAHLPSDYIEAAHTAFETNDFRQAMEILKSGLFRFPLNVDFAIRAAWIFLLTDQPREALSFLGRATDLGIPPGEVENTTALLAIAHAQLGDPGRASSYLAQLIAISPKWKNPESLETLPWPETFKSTLKMIISQQPENEPAPPPESDPKDTAPRSEESPIPEPPLPSR